MLEEIKKTAAFVRTRTEDFAPEVGIILGTGLGDFADKIDARFIIEYKDVPGFPVSTVEGHKGRMIFGEIEGRRVVAMQGTDGTICGMAAPLTPALFRATLFSVAPEPPPCWKGVRSAPPQAPTCIAVGLSHRIPPPDLYLRAIL